MAAEDYSIRINVDSTDATRAERNMRDLGREVNNTERNLTAMSSTSRAASAALSGLGGVVAGLSVGQLSKSIFDVNKEMQSLRTSLETVTGSAKNADIAFQGIQKFASTTPYSVKEITEAFIKMKALGLAPTESALTSFGNTASAMGKSLKQMIEAVADASTGEMERLKEFGIKASKDGDNFKMTFKGVTTTVKDSSTEIIKYLEKIGNTDFAGGMDRQAKTMNGALSSLSDSWDAFQDHILSDASENSIARWVGNATAMLTRFDTWINGAFTKTGKLAELREQQNAAMRKINASEQSGLVGKAVDAIGGAVWGYSVEKEKQKLAAIGKQMEDLKKEIAADEITKTKITAAAPEKKKTEEVKKSHKGLSDAQKELNRQQAEYKDLLESTPYGEYNATVDKLTNALKNNGINQSTYTTLLNEANARLLDSTDYVKENTKAINEQTRAKQMAFEATARGKFEKGTEELRGQKPFMSETEYSSKQDKLTADYLTQQQGKNYKTPAEQAAEATKGFEELNKKLSDTATAFDNVGNSSKMAFDGLLGGFSAVAGAIGSFSDEMTKLQEGFNAGSKAYSDFMLQEGTTFEQREKATKDYYKMKDRFDSASFKAEISGARQLAGAAKNLFGEKSAARKAFHAIEMGMSVIEMAMAAKKMVVDVAAGAANMFAQGGFAGFAGVAAMGAVMAGLGFAISGGSSEPQDMRTMKNDSGTTGTVKGDFEKTSESISNSMKLLNETGIDQLLELRDLNSNFTALVRSVDKTVEQAVALKGSFVPSTKAMTGNPTIADKNPLGSTGAIAASLGTSIALGATGALSTAGLYAGAALINAGATSIGIGISTAAASSATMAATTGAALGATGATATMIGGAVLGLAGGLILAGLQYGLGKLLGIGKTKYEAIGNGIVTGIGEMTLDGMKSAVTAYDYSTVKATTKGWFSDSKKIYDVINSVDMEVSMAMNSVFDNLGKSIGSAFKYLGISDLVQKGAVIPQMKFDLSKAKTNDEIGKLITGALNTMSDKLATEIAGGFFEPLQKSGEGMLETIMRVTKEVANAAAAFDRLGMNLKMTPVGLMTFSNTLVSLYESAPNANDALKNFISTMNAFTDAVLTPLQQFQYNAKNWVDFATKFNEKNKTSISTSYAGLNRENVIGAFDTVTKNLVKASEAESLLTKNAQNVTNAVNPYTAFDPAQLDQKAWAGLVSGGYERMTSASLSPQILSTIKAGAGSQNQYTQIWKDMLRVIETNDAKKLAGQSALTQDANLAKYLSGGKFDVDAYNRDVTQLKAATTDAAESVASLTQQAKALETAFKFIEKSLDLNESVLKNVTSATQTKNRVQQKELSTLDNTIDIQKDLSEQTISLIKSWGGLSDATKITQQDTQRYIYTLEDAAKATKNLADSGKFLSDFSNGISKWVKNLRATQLGNPESQIKSARSNFEQTLQQARFGVTGEEKRTALGEITGYADTYMNAIKSFYGSSEQGQKELERVISEVSGLDKVVPVAELQLNKLTDIQDAILTSTIEIPKGMGVEFSKFIESAKLLGESSKANPTIENQLAFDTASKIVLMVDTASKSGKDAQFLNAMVNSFSKDGELASNLKLIINDAGFESGKKSEIIDNVLASFNEKTLTIKNFEFDLKDTIDAAKAFVEASWNPPVLDVNDESAKTKLSGLSKGLKEFDNSYYDSVIDINNTDAITKLNDVIATANAAKTALDALGMAQDANQNANTTSEKTLFEKYGNTVYPKELTSTELTKLEDAIGLGGISSIVKLGNSFSAMGGGVYVRGDIDSLPMFAKGGIATQPSIFGESGVEAAVPLPDGRSIPVTLTNAANDDGATVAELKAQNQKLEMLVNTLMATSKAEREKTQELIDTMNGLRADTRLKRAV